MDRNTIVITVLAVLLVAAGAYLLFATTQKPSTETATGAQAPAATNGNASSGFDEFDAVQNQPAGPADGAARQDLANRLETTASNIVITKVEARTWSDGCLGLGGPTESCLAALVSGYRVEMVAKGKTYVYRTNSTGTVLRLETAVQ